MLSCGFGGVSSARLSPRANRSSAPGSSFTSSGFLGALVTQARLLLSEFKFARYSFHVRLHMGQNLFGIVFVVMAATVRDVVAPDVRQIAEFNRRLLARIKETLLSLRGAGL